MISPVMGIDLLRLSQIHAAERKRAHRAKPVQVLIAATPGEIVPNHHVPPGVDQTMGGVAANKTAPPEINALFFIWCVARLDYQWRRAKTTRVSGKVFG